MKKRQKSRVQVIPFIAAHVKGEEHYYCVMDHAEGWSKMRCSGRTRNYAMVHEWRAHCLLRFVYIYRGFHADCMPDRPDSAEVSEISYLVKQIGGWLSFPFAAADLPVVWNH